LSSTADFRQGIFKSGLVRHFVRWLDAGPHPPLACEITPGQIAAVRFTRTGGVDGFAVEALPPGAIVPSAVEPNIVNTSAVRTTMGSVFSRLGAQGMDVALLLPDPVIRVFVQHFEEFPRKPQQALPILRWKLKKSVPFETEETQISYMRQQPREEGVDVVTGLARQRIVREYEALAEAAGLHPGVVLSSSLAAISLLDDRGPTLLARVSGTSLTTAIVRQGILCGYRCTELPEDSSRVTPAVLLEEVFPVAAYYQDTWQEEIRSVRVAGLGRRLDEFTGPFEAEFHCPIRGLLSAAAADGIIRGDARPLAERELDGLVGWMLHHG